jgi:hypothetical protein
MAAVSVLHNASFVQRLIVAAKAGGFNLLMDIC